MGIFETYNEPLQQDWPGVIKPYHEQLVSEIRSYARDSIIVLGTRTWSQDVDLAAYDPVYGTNLAYTLHFYAATHKGGCCRFGADCGDCGEDGTGWCHQSASNCTV